MTPGLKPDGMVPLYQQLIDTIREQIAKGEYKAGERIPSEPQLIATYGVSRITVRNAIQHLVDEGILTKRHGKGTYVTMPAYVESLSAGGSFTESCVQINAVPGTKVISRQYITAPGRVADALGLPAGDEVLCIKRLRLVDGTPAIFEVDYFPEEFGFLLHEELENVSILQVIRGRTGLALKEFADVFDIQPAAREHGAYLDCPPGIPLLQVRQTVLTEQLRVMYYNEQFIHTARYKYAIRSY